MRVPASYPSRVWRESARQGKNKEAGNEKRLLITSAASKIGNRSLCGRHWRRKRREGELVLCLKEEPWFAGEETKKKEGKTHKKRPHNCGRLIFRGVSRGDSNPVDGVKDGDGHFLPPLSYLYEDIYFLELRMGRLWQTLILSKWRPVLAYMPVESIVRNRQEEYYASQGQADAQGEAIKFMEFMLQALHDTLADVHAITPVTTQVIIQVSPKVKRLLTAREKGEYSAGELMQVLGLKSAKNFRATSLTPALNKGLVERTQPDSPRSPTQRYRLTERGRSVLRE